MKKKIWNYIKTAWEFSKGNKTIFVQAVWLAIEVGLIPITGPWLLFVRGMLSLFLGGSLVDHAKKGYFSTRKISIENKKK